VFFNLKLFTIARININKNKKKINKKFIEIGIKKQPVKQIQRFLFHKKKNYFS